MFFSYKTLMALFLGTVLSFASTTAMAAASAAQEEEQESSGGSTFMSPATYNRLTRVHTDIEEGKYNDALEELRDLAEDVKDRAYEYAVVMQTFGYVYISQEQWETAAKYFEQALKANALPEAPQKQVIYTLAQIYATLGQYNRTITLMTDWFKTAKNPPADAYIIVANAYAAQDKFREAYPYVMQAIQKSEEPREDWYKLALGVQFELKKYSEAAETLEIMVAHWSDELLYWRQLSGVSIELGNDDRALAALAIPYEKGMLEKDTDLLNLVRLYMLNEVPFKGGLILEKALAEEKVERSQKNYELLSQAWVYSREFEKGIEAMGKAAALAEDGELYLRQAQLYLSLADWKGASAAAANAIEKGGLDSEKTGRAWLLQGTAAAESDDFDTAVMAFNKARGYPETRQTASQWLNYVQTEQQVSTLN